MSSISQQVLAAADRIRKAHNAKDYTDREAEWAIINAGWQQILDKYPRLFAGDNIGLGAGVGWWVALEEAFAAIDAVLDKYPGLTFNAVQIKEKFGGLRFYYDIGHDGQLTEEAYQDARKLVDDIVERAEVVASSACESCGQPGKRRGGGWIRTLCDEHATADK